MNGVEGYEEANDITKEYEDIIKANKKNMKFYYNILHNI